MNIQQMMKQAQQMQEKLQRELAETEVDATAGELSTLRIVVVDLISTRIELLAAKTGRKFWAESRHMFTGS